MDDKIIVSNSAVLKDKYGSSGVTKIEKAVERLIAADSKRGIKSRLVYLDRPAQMKSFRGNAVDDPGNPRQNKQAIDAIFRAANPEYLMILGAPDVVPHQDMTNLVFEPPNDPDRYVTVICHTRAIRRTRATSPHSGGRPASLGDCRI